MGDQMRMTGLFSGLDTENIIQSLVSVKQKKVTDLKNDQTKLEWKQKAWQDLNAKIYSFYSSTMSQMRLTGGYSKKTTKVSDPTKATIVANDAAVTGSQSLKINSLAKSGYLTGAKLNQKTTKETYKEKQPDGTESEKVRDVKVDWTTDDKLKDIMGESDISSRSIRVTVGTGENQQQKTIELTNDMTVGKFTNLLKEAGVNASFDTGNQRFFVSSTKSGTGAGFTLENIDGATDTLSKLGIDKDATYADIDGHANACTMIDAQDAEIELNGAIFTSDKNTFNINGLSITATAVTGDEEITITTDNDYDGIYDMIKDMLSEYNDIIKDVYKKYNADSARKFNMLTEDEKEAMTDDEVEKWEDTIKDSLLRRDKDLYTIMNILTDSMSNGVEIDGKKRYLSEYGIGTLPYFDSEDDDKKSLHIDGDKDDEKTGAKEDKLKAAIASDPEGTIKFFSALCNQMYTNIGETMKRSEYRSIYKVYDDKSLQSDYDSYAKKIAEAQSKLDDYEDRWYDKFSKMEVALSKLQSNQNSLAGMLGN